MGQRRSDRNPARQGRHIPYFFIYYIRNIDGDVAPVALRPSFLPEVAGYFRYFGDSFRQLRAVIKY